MGSSYPKVRFPLTSIISDTSKQLSENFSQSLNVDYSELKKSKKFTPALYHENDGIWEESKIPSSFSDSCLEVSEIMDVNGKRTFGYDDPIIYKRV